MSSQLQLSSRAPRSLDLLFFIPGEGHKVGNMTHGFPVLEKVGTPTTPIGLDTVGNIQEKNGTTTKPLELDAIENIQEQALYTNDKGTDG